MIQEPTRFWKGVKKDVAPRLLEEGYLQDALNVHARDGALRKRSGFRLVHASSSLSGALAWPTLLWSMFLPEEGIGQTDTGGGGPSSESEDIPIDDPGTVESINLPDPGSLTGDDPEKDEAKAAMCYVVLPGTVYSCVPFRLTMYRGVSGEGTAAVWTATSSVTLSLPDGSPANLSTGWTAGQWSYSGKTFDERWSADVVDLENTAELAELTVTLSGTGAGITAQSAQTATLQHPVFPVAIPSSVTAGVAFTMTISAAIDGGATLTGYIGEGDGLSVTAYTATEGVAWEALAAFTASGGGAIDLTTGWTDGVWSGSVLVEYAGPHDLLGVETTFPKNRPESSGLRQDTATLVASATRLVAVLPDSVVADTSFTLTLYGDDITGSGVTLTVTEKLNSTGATVPVTLKTVAGVDINVTTGWTSGSYDVGSAHYNSRWQASVYDPVNTAEYDRLVATPAKVGYQATGDEVTLYHPTFGVSLPAETEEDTAFTLTITAQNPISGATLTGYLGSGDGITRNDYTGDGDATWHALATLTLADGNPIVMTTGWTAGVWSVSVKFTYTGADTHLKVQTTYPKNRPASLGYSYDTSVFAASVLDVCEAIYERQRALGLSTAWDPLIPSNPDNLIDITGAYAYSLTELKPYVGLLTTSYGEYAGLPPAGSAFLSAPYSTGGAWPGIILSETYGSDAATLSELYGLVCALQQLYFGNHHDGNNFRIDVTNTATTWAGAGTASSLTAAQNDAEVDWSLTTTSGGRMSAGKSWSQYYSPYTGYGDYTASIGVCAGRYTMREGRALASAVSWKALLYAYIEPAGGTGTFHNQGFSQAASGDGSIALLYEMPAYVPAGDVHIADTGDCLDPTQEPTTWQATAGQFGWRQANDMYEMFAIIEWDFVHT